MKMRFCIKLLLQQPVSTGWTLSATKLCRNPSFSCQQRLVLVVTEHCPSLAAAQFLVVVYFASLVHAFREKKYSWALRARVRVPRLSQL